MIADPCISICADRCAQFGEPPCFDVDRDAGRPWKPCDDCKLDADMEVIDEIDPNAVIRPLL